MTETPGDVAKDVAQVKNAAKDVAGTAASAAAPAAAKVESRIKQFTKYTVNSPMLIGIFLIVASFINKDLKGIMWLTGAFISTVFTQILLKLFGRRRKKEEVKDCVGIFPGDTNPALSGNIIAYTLSYMLFPMLRLGVMNYQIVSTLVTLYGLSSYYRLSSEGACRALAHEVILIGISGFLVGYMWYKTLRDNGQEKLLYYTEPLSNSDVCTLPKKTQFKCKMYKDGEIVNFVTI